MNTSESSVVSTSNDAGATVAPAPSPAKWQTGADLGPIMANKVNKALNSLAMRAKQVRTLTGIKTDTLPPDDGCRSYLLFGGPTHPEYSAKIVELQAKHGATVTAANYKALLADVDALCQWFHDNPMIDDQRITQEEHDAKVAADRAANEKRNAEDAARQAKVNEVRSQLEAVRPPWATAAIVAYYEEDACDMLTDYFATITKRAIVLGFRGGKRDDFGLMRRLAAQHPETAALDCTEAEHRDNHSMGRGNYLKLGGRYSTGWYVQAVSLDGYFTHRLASLPCEFAVKAEASTSAPAGSGEVSGNGVTVKRNAEKDGVELHFPGKPSQDVIDRVKAGGFRWSRFSKCWYAKASNRNLAFAYELAGDKEQAAKYWDAAGVQAMSEEACGV